MLSYAKKYIHCSLQCFTFTFFHLFVCECLCLFAFSFIWAKCLKMAIGKHNTSFIFCWCCSFVARVFSIPHIHIMCYILLHFIHYMIVWHTQTTHSLSLVALVCFCSHFYIFILFSFIAYCVYFFIVVHFIFHVDVRDFI